MLRFRLAGVAALDVVDLRRAAAGAEAGEIDSFSFRVSSTPSSVDVETAEGAVIVVEDRGIISESITALPVVVTCVANSPAATDETAGVLLFGLIPAPVPGVGSGTFLPTSGDRLAGASGTANPSILLSFSLSPAPAEIEEGEALRFCCCCFSIPAPGLMSVEVGTATRGALSESR